MLLAIIAIIAVPSVINQVKKSNEKAYETQLLLIESGAESYAYEHPISDDYGTVLITLKILQDSGYVDKNIVNPITGEDFDENMSIQITKLNGSYSVMLFNNGFLSCTINDDCEYGSLIGSEIKFDPVNNNTCTTGTTCYTWNVIGYNSESVDIMMNENLGSNVVWNENISCSNNGVSCANNSPATIFSVLNLRTNTWKYSARIIEAEEILSILGETELNAYFGTDYLTGYSNCNDVICNVNMTIYGWLLGTATNSYSSGDADVYWVNTASSTSEGRAYEVRYGLSLGNIISYSNVYSHGIRPVITVSRTIIE